MTPFERVHVKPNYDDLPAIAAATGQRLTVLRRERNRATREVYRNDCYQVIIRRYGAGGRLIDAEAGGALVHLSIRRLDNAAIHDWRDLQEIKNALVGAECEGVEIYPAESRLVDTCNQFHIWAFPDPALRARRLRRPAGSRRARSSGSSEGIQPGWPKREC